MLKMSKSFRTVIKLTILGDARSGKSSLLLKYADDVYSESYLATIGVDFRIKTLTAGATDCKLQIWDCAGEERFRIITSSYYRGTHGYVLVFDVTNRDSFLHLSQKVEDIVKYGREDTPAILVGNKCDLESDRQVTIEEIEEFAVRYSLRYIETSAKTGYNINELFTTIAEDVVHDVRATFRGNWSDQYVLVTPEMWCPNVMDDSAALVVTL